MLFLLTLGTYRVVTGGHYTGCTGDWGPDDFSTRPQPGLLWRGYSDYKLYLLERRTYSSETCPGIPLRSFHLGVFQDEGPRWNPSKTQGPTKRKSNKNSMDPTGSRRRPSRTEYVDPEEKRVVKERDKERGSPVGMKWMGCRREDPQNKKMFIMDAENKVTTKRSEQVSGLKSFERSIDWPFGPFKNQNSWHWHWKGHGMSTFLHTHRHPTPPLRSRSGSRPTWI